MAAPVIGAIIGAVVGGVAGGLNAKRDSEARAKAYKKYADDIRKAAEKYSGKKAYDSIVNEGSKEGQFQQNQFGLANPIVNGNLSANNINNASGNYYQQGNNLGRATKQSELNAKYNAATTEANTALQQANLAANVNQAFAQGAMNTAGGLADLAGNIGSGKATSDERAKESPNNESGLPKADIEDSLRQLETVEYQYKPGEGPQDGKHVGTTAQSMEKTPLFKDCVDNSGEMKQIGMWKLQEALTAGIANLQKEIDELEQSRHQFVNIRNYQ